MATAVPRRTTGSRSAPASLAQRRCCRSRVRTPLDSRITHLGSSRTQREQFASARPKSICASRRRRYQAAIRRRYETDVVEIVAAGFAVQVMSAPLSCVLSVWMFRRI
jgi:hypothetical protein